MQSDINVSLLIELMLIDPYPLADPGGAVNV